MTQRPQATLHQLLPYTQLRLLLHLPAMTLVPLLAMGHMRLLLTTADLMATSQLPLLRTATPATATKTCYPQPRRCFQAQRSLCTFRAPRSPAPSLVPQNV
ncbi:hypothetical protein IW139_003152 [Coemansia sp. RSA 353]